MRPSQLSESSSIENIGQADAGFAIAAGIVERNQEATRTRRAHQMPPSKELASYSLSDVTVRLKKDIWERADWGKIQQLSVF